MFHPNQAKWLVIFCTFVSTGLSLTVPGRGFLDLFKRGVKGDGIPSIGKKTFVPQISLYLSATHVCVSGTYENKTSR